MAGRRGKAAALVMSISWRSCFGGGNRERLHVPARHDAIIDPFECSLSSKERYAQVFCREAKKWIGNAQESAQKGDHGEVCGYTDQHQAAYLLRVTNNVFSGNGPSK